MVAVLGILLGNSWFGLMKAAAEAMVSVMVALILKGTGDVSNSSWVPMALLVVSSMASMASDSAIGPDWFTVVKWKMGAGAPLLGVI